MISETKIKINDILSLEEEYLKNELKSNVSKESTLIEGHTHKKGQWTKEEDMILQEVIEKFFEVYDLQNIIKTIEYFVETKNKIGDFILILNPLGNLDIFQDLKAKIKEDPNYKPNISNYLPPKNLENIFNS